MTPDEEKARYEQVIETHPADREHVLTVLQDLQRAFGYVPGRALEMAADRVAMPPADLYALASLYSELSFAPGAAAPVKEVPPLEIRHLCDDAIVFAGLSDDPTGLDAYRASGGYEALQRALDMDPDEVISQIEESGLRGKGGAGFPTGRKWRSAATAPGTHTYFICNGNEGDPSTFVDAALMELAPHRVLEGLIIGSYAVGAHEAFVYVREEYTTACEHMQRAVDAAVEAGILGASILGSGFSLDVSLVRGGGAFVCGESSSLMNAIEGRIAEPDASYAHRTEHGLYGEPTVLNNVETLAAVPFILRFGPERFSEIGTEGSKGTKAFSISGRVAKPGIVEVPFGTTWRELVRLAGGMTSGESFKALICGGPSENCVCASELDIPIDFDILRDNDLMMGSGGIVVLGEHDCMVQTALYYVNFSAGGSCGKCTPCREGLRQLQAILGRISSGSGSSADIALAKRIGHAMQDAALCALGRSAANPVISAMEKFPEEFDQHISGHRCPAGACELSAAADEGGTR